MLLIKNLVRLVEYYTKIFIIINYIIIKYLTIKY